jgi:hypothetical protein
MNRAQEAGSDEVVEVLRQCLAEGLSVDIESVGTFQLDAAGRIHFSAARGKRVFLAYAIEDVAAVEELYDRLEQAGFRPWMDRRKLLPGQNWARAIDRAISVSDIFVPCFSKRAIEKPGRFHAELRYALDRALEWPIEKTFIVPIRLDECRVPRQISNQLQYIDLFPDAGEGTEKLIEALKLTIPASS